MLAPAKHRRKGHPSRPTADTHTPVGRGWARHALPAAHTPLYLLLQTQGMFQSWHAVLCKATVEESNQLTHQCNADKRPYEEIKRATYKPTWCLLLQPKIQQLKPKSDHCHCLSPPPTPNITLSESQPHFWLFSRPFFKLSILLLLVAWS